MREVLRQLVAALARRRDLRRVLAVAALARLHVGGLNLAVFLVVHDATGALAAAGLAAGALSLGVGATRPLQGWLMDVAGARVLALVAVPHAAAGVAAAALADGLPTAALVVLAFAVGVTAPAISVATAAAWAGELDDRRRPAVFGVDIALQDAAYLLGPLLAGAVAALAGAPVALVALVAIGAAGAWALAGILGPARRVQGATAAGRRWAPRGVTGLLVAMVGVGATFGAIGVASVAVVLDAGHDALAGPITAALFAGGLAGDLLVAPRRADQPVAARLAFRLALLTVAAAALPAAPGVPGLAAAIVAVGVLLAAAHVTLLLGIAAQAPADGRAVAFGWAGAAIRLGSALGSASAGMVAGAFSARAALALAAAGAGAALLACVAGMTVRAPARRGRAQRA